MLRFTVCDLPDRITIQAEKNGARTPVQIPKNTYETGLLSQ
jgi:hypothetical protein